VIAAMKKWAGDDAAKRKQLQAACQRILQGDLGNETARAALKKLSEE